MITVHIGYLKDTTAGLLNVYADENDGYCEFEFGDVKIIYQTYPNYDGARWVAYFTGVVMMRSYTFEHLALFLNSMFREKMNYCVLIDCWIENHQ